LGFLFSGVIIFEDGEDMADWSPEVVCPGCGSKETRFVEPHYEASVYECLACGLRFEITEEG
jgi:DNA-directed RNA polymerase subunit RPC12/RpoP